MDLFLKGILNQEGSEKVRFYRSKSKHSSHEGRSISKGKSSKHILISETNITESKKVESSERKMSIMSSRGRVRNGHFKVKEEDSNMETLAVSEPREEIKTNVGDDFLKKILEISSQKEQQTPGNEAKYYFKDNAIKVDLDSDPSHLSNKKEHEITSLWLGQIYDKCTSSSFKHFITKNLDYNEAKTYCCEQILTNLIEVLRKGKKSKMFMRLPSISEINSTQILHRKIKSITYNSQPMKYLNEESAHILEYLCSKYPQTDIQGVNKQVAELVNSKKIDNWLDDEYDLLRLSDVSFKYNLTGDYSKEIMRFLNFLIELPYKKHRKHAELTNYKYFEKIMNRIFEVVFHKDSKEKNGEADLSRLFNEQGFVNFSEERRSYSEEEIEYREKVKSYTSILIGSKIPSTAKIFSQEEIDSGIIKIENNQVARVLDKWAEELSSKFYEAEKSILNRIYRFKSVEKPKFHKLNETARENLFKIVSEKKKKLEEFTNKMKESIYDLSNKLGSSTDSDIAEMNFVDEKEKMVAEFAVKMAESSSVYFIEIIQRQISLLLESVEALKKKELSVLKFKESPTYQAMNIDLITFKIGDLMRCKMVSNENEILRVLQVFITLSEMWDDKLIKIIRIKNRLESGTRDILINFMFDEVCTCELQLAVAEKISEKQQYFDKFNHFLYEIKRAYLGPVMEMCKIWYQYESKSQTFAKKIKKSTARKLKSPQLPADFQKLSISENLYDICEYNFPFVCESCKVFCPRNTIIFFNSCINSKIYCGNCVRIKISMSGDEVVEIKKRYVFKKYLIRYPNFVKFMDMMTELSDLSIIAKRKFQIHIPLNSRLIYLQFSMVVVLQNEGSDYLEYVFITTKLTKDGQIIQETCSNKVSKTNKSLKEKKIITTKQMEENIAQEYIFYSWDVPTYLVPYPRESSEHFTEMIDRFLPHIRKLQEEKGYENVKIGAAEIVKGKFYYFPFFVVDEVKMTDQLIHKGNIDALRDSLIKKEEVIELSNKKMTSEWTEISPSSLLQMSHTVKELYINSNFLIDLSFVGNLHVLKILHASSNSLKEIPNIPMGLEELHLDDNKIERINRFKIKSPNTIDGNEESRLLVLNLSKNGIVKIENLQGLKRLKNLYLIKNEIVKIEGIPLGVEVLGLYENKISKIENVSELVELRNVSFASNRISKIENLEGCENLCTLALDSNQITQIENLHTLKNLKVLRLSHTHLSCRNISNASKYEGIIGLNKLKTFLVEGNQVTCLLQITGWVGANGGGVCGIGVNPFVELEELSLANNEIYKIDHYEDIMPMLKEVNVSNNKIESISNISKLTYLTSFNVSCNRIKKLPETNWENIFQLKYLNLSNNLLSHIPNLHPLLLIQDLNLSHNRIVSIEGLPGEPLQYADFERLIDLSYNSLFKAECNENEWRMTLESFGEAHGDWRIILAANGENEERKGRLKEIALNHGVEECFIFGDEKVKE